MTPALRVSLHSAPAEVRFTPVAQRHA